MYKCSIIGFGNIAYGYDTSSSKPSKTHYSAFSNHPNCQIEKIFDPKSINIPNEYKTDNIEEVLNSDIVSVCSPSSLHFNHLEFLIKNKIPMIWLEKPPVTTIDEVKKTRELIKTASSKVLVNYTRRYSEQYSLLKNILIGDIKSIRLTYTRGFETNGSHLIDFLLFLLPDLKKYEVLYTSGSNEPNAILRYQDIYIHISNANVDYQCLDFEVTTKDKRISIMHGGSLSLTESVIENPSFPGFYQLDDSIQTSLHNSPGTVLDDVLLDLISTDSKHCISNLNSALDSVELLLKIVGKHE